MGKRFNNGDIVYWCHQNGYKYEVHYGMVDEQFSDAVIVDYLAPKETRKVNGIPIDKFESETKYKKLPKGWTYNTKLYEITYDNEEFKNIKVDITNPESIKEAYNKGYLIKKEKIFSGIIEADITKDGYRIVKKYPLFHRNITTVSIRPEKLYFTYEEAKQEVDKNIAEFERQLNMSDYEWSVEQIDKTLDGWQSLYGVSDETKQLYRNWLLNMDNVEDIEIRLINGGIQWKYTNKKKWSNIEL